MIKFFDFEREYSKLNNEILEKINSIIKKGNFINGEEVKSFESNFSEYIGSDYGLGVNSGSDALFMAVKSLDIGNDDEVITVSNTFISSVDAISRNQAVPVFVDVNTDTFCIDVSKIEEKITNKTKAILVVHLFGHPVDMDPVMKIAKDHDLFVIEDCCQAHGAKYKGKKVGSIGDLGCFSFYPVKNLGAYGDGGFITLNNEFIYEKLSMMRNYGQSTKNHHEFLGLNSRLDEIQAGILNLKLKYLDKWNSDRKLATKVYNKHLDNTIYKLPKVKKYADHVYHLYVIQSRNRDQIQNYLKINNVQTMIHYPKPVHQQKAYKYLDHYELPNTEVLCNKILSLPMNPWIKEYEIEKICEIMNYEVYE